MNKSATTSALQFCCLLLIATLGVSRAVFARVANPTIVNPGLEMYGVDSDDNSDLAPVYNFVDTAYGTWSRVSNFSGGIAYLPQLSPNMKFSWYQGIRGITYGTLLTTSSVQNVYVSQYGTIALDSAANQTFSTSSNGPFPISGAGWSIIAPLWGNLEMRTTGDSSKLFVRAVADSVYISFYNFALAGTNGLVRATFQVVFCDQDTSVTMNYRSFDGGLNGVSAAAIFQRNVTIGVQNSQGLYGTTYLDRGVYYAQSNAGPQYAKNLHNQLAIKFLRRVNNQVRIRSIGNPPSANYEFTSNSIVPNALLENMTAHSDTASCQFYIVNLLTGATVFHGADTEEIDNLGTKTFTSKTTFTPASCGYYKVTAVADVPAHPDVDWTGDNYRSQTFYYFQNQTSYPFIEDFSYSLNPCAWETHGAQVAPGDSIMRIPTSPRDGISGALILDRLDYNGNPYSVQVPTTGDTIETAPINLQGKGSVYLTFVYQRGSKTDSLKAGINNRVLSGPERTILNAAGAVVQQGDTLLVEGLDSNAAALNPAGSGWVTIAALDGGLDATPNFFRILLPGRFVAGHFRLRFRLLGHDNSTAGYALPVDDNDSWVVDAIQLSNSTDHNDLTPVDISFGSAGFTHIPRNVGIIFPQVRIRNNGIGNTAAQNVVVSISDQLGRTVYFRRQTFYMDVTHADTVLTLNGWNILGSQGGVFSAYVSIQNDNFDYDHLNDTNTFVKTLFIDDVYALDDNGPDTAGSMQSAQTEFYELFTPLSSDSLRGCDMYMMNNSGSSMNWTVAIQDYGTDTTTIATRGLSYSTTASGWFRSNFSPVYLTAGKPYRLHFTQTSGSGVLGGDASRALQFYTMKDPTGSNYGVEFPSIDSLFQNSGQIYYPGTAATNIAGGGLLLPMVRMVFQGSQTYLPVELVSFSGSRLASGAASLIWKTAKEDGVLTYTVERQTESGWEFVSSNAAAGISTGSNYSVNDANAPATELTYRLRETELDGTMHDLGTATVSAIGVTQSRSLGAYPNPSTEWVHVTMNGAPIDQLVVRDVLGRTLFTLSPDQVSRPEVDLDFSTLPSGSYYLQAQSGGQWFAQHITIQH